MALCVRSQRQRRSLQLQVIILLKPAITKHKHHLAIPVLCNLFLTVHVTKTVYFEPDYHRDIQMYRGRD
jgi:hypothetical protein